MISLLYNKKKKKFVKTLMSNAMDTNYFTTFLQTADVSNFQIIIGKHKCDVSIRLILELIRISHINIL